MYSKNSKKLKVGFLPTYMKLFDENVPEMEENASGFISIILKELKKLFEIVEVPVAKTKTDFRKAIKIFESESVDAIITLHLAYSLSGEAAGILSNTDIPIIILNTTPDNDFGPGQDASRIIYNHGIHGIQDLCNILVRNGKRFFIEAGHWKESDIFKRIYKRVLQTRMVNTFYNIKIGRIGNSLEGMDDFKVPDSLLVSKYGFDIIQTDSKAVLDLEKKINNSMVEEEIVNDSGRFLVEVKNKELLKGSIKTGLAIRKWRKDNRLKAFVANAFYFSKENRIPYIPFLEVSKSLSEGIGYAGEGDILTAAFTASLLSSYPESTFTEMFCPDWSRKSIFLSHAGEVNINTLEEPHRIIEKPWNFSKGNDPITPVGRLKKGESALCTLSPIGEEKFRLILSKGKMISFEKADNFNNVIHGWFKPDLGLEDFLEEFSRLGGIHHSVLVYDAESQDIEGFGEMMGWDIKNL